MCLWTYEGAMSGSGSATQSCSSTPKIMPVSPFTNGQIGGGANDGATVATVPGAGCNTYDGVHITAYGNRGSSSRAGAFPPRFPDACQ